MNFFESIESRYEKKEIGNAPITDNDYPDFWEKLEDAGGFIMRMTEMFPDINTDTIKFLNSALERGEGEGNVSFYNKKRCLTDGVADTSCS